MITWSSHSTSILFAAIINLLILIVAVIYKNKVIQPNAQKPMWKIRRPQWFFFYVMIVTTNDFFRCFIPFLRSVDYISPQTFTLLLKPTTYYGSLTFASLRLWFLYYDLSHARKQQKSLLQKHLIDSANPKSKISKNSFGKSKKATKAVVIIATLFFCIALALDLLGLQQLSTLIIFAYVLLAMGAFSYFLFSLGCPCTCCHKDKNGLKTSYSDNSWLLLEMKLIYVLWIVGSIVGALLLTPIHPSDDIYGVYVAWITTVSRMINSVIILMVPYYILQRSNKTSDDKHTKDTDKLPKVLSSKGLFFKFVEHLVQEICMENLTFLVAVWQFKFEQKFKLSQKKSGKSGKKPVDNAGTLAVPTPTSNNSPISPDTPASMVTPSSTDHEFSEFEDSRNIASLSMSYAASSNWNSETLLKMFEMLPWKRLPLSQCIGYCPLNKWKQCQLIYSKFISEDAYDMVNISYAAKGLIDSNYRSCAAFLQSNSNGMGIDKQIEIEMFEITTRSSKSIESNSKKDKEVESDSENGKMTKEEFDKRLLEMFDFALNDVMDNLSDSLRRFVRTEGYKS